MGKSEKNDDSHFKKQTACFFSRKLLKHFIFQDAHLLGMTYYTLGHTTTTTLEIH
jgi:hypothetical protein